MKRFLRFERVLPKFLPDRLPRIMHLVAVPPWSLLNRHEKQCLELRKGGQVARETWLSWCRDLCPQLGPYAGDVSCQSFHCQLSRYPPGVCLSGGQDGGLNFWQAVQGNRESTGLWVKRAEFKS